MGFIIPDIGIPCIAFIIGIPMFELFIGIGIAFIMMGSSYVPAGLAQGRHLPRRCFPLFARRSVSPAG
jgi:hypothetical protein